MRYTAACHAIVFAASVSLDGLADAICEDVGEENVGVPKEDDMDKGRARNN
jgi:hypothetical protein